MATMIPESIPAKASQGEKTVFGILRDKLPDDFIVWYEPLIKMLYPDFVILSPTFGLLILEVKGWSSGSIEQANSNTFMLRWHQGNTVKITSQTHPLRQAHAYFAAISDRLTTYPILCQLEGNYKGRLAFPIGMGAIMSNMMEAEAQKANIDSLLPKPHVTYRDELNEWKKWSECRLIQRLQEMFKVKFPFFPLTSDQISTIKGLVYPWIGIKEVPALPESLPPEVQFLPPPGSTVLISMDLEQERIARSMGEGHRLLSGVAGAGKTLILFARAKILADRDRSHRILILCYNIVLAAYLRSILQSDDSNPQYQQQIEVRHFHDWAKSILGRLPNPKEFQKEGEYDEFLGDLVLAKLNERSLENKWDFLLVDEAHTFIPKWFRCCLAALKDPENGNITIVSDASQGLYRREKFTWKSVGIKAQGRTTILKRNYRNTQEILNAAWNIVKPSDKEAIEKDPTFPVVEPSTALRKGKKPVLYLAKSKVDAVKAAIHQVCLLCNFGYEHSEIAIVYRYIGQDDRKLFENMINQCQELSLNTYWVTENPITKYNYNINTPGERIITGKSSLGLEFKAVLILWIEQFWDCCSNDLEKAKLARQELYVAMTRAQDELYLFGSGSDRILRELETSQEFTVVRESNFFEK